MKPITYRNGRTPRIGDVVTLSGQKGKIKLVGEELLQWGLSREDVAEGRVMIEMDNGALVCNPAYDEDLDFLSPAPE